MMDETRCFGSPLINAVSNPRQLDATAPLQFVQLCFAFRVDGDRSSSDTNIPYSPQIPVSCLSSRKHSTLDLYTMFLMALSTPTCVEISRTPRTARTETHPPKSPPHTLKGQADAQGAAGNT